MQWIWLPAWQVYWVGDRAGAAVGIINFAATLPTSTHAAGSCDAVQPVPVERWDVEDVQQASSVPMEARFGSFVAGADLFDAVALRISRCIHLHLWSLKFGCQRPHRLHRNGLKVQCLMSLFTYIRHDSWQQNSLRRESLYSLALQA
jgi:hypothetical protein